MAKCPRAVGSAATDQATARLVAGSGGCVLLRRVEKCGGGLGAAISESRSATSRPFSPKTNSAVSWERKDLAVCAPGVVGNGLVYRDQ
jgi:hypothetical protein